MQLPYKEEPKFHKCNDTEEQGSRDRQICGIRSNLKDFVDVKLGLKQVYNWVFLDKLYILNLICYLK